MASASQAPDPKVFKAWEDAFAYPIPAVRRMEQQLRTEISGNRERLRSLVGGSYRDLLGTADTIIEMDGRMHGVEALVARVGRCCNSALLERTKAQSHTLTLVAEHPVSNSKSGLDSSKASGPIFGLREAKGSRLNVRRGRADYTLASQLAVFKSCPHVITRILKKNESLLVAAKVLVISRILYKTLKTADGQFQDATESTFGRLGRIRSKLLEAIEQKLAKAPVENDELVDAMSAYALATTSSAADILRHFHQVRATSMTRYMQNARNDEKNVAKALEMWLHTLRDTPAIFPRLLSQALNRLKSKPLLSGEDVQEVASLELDIHQSWLGEEIVGFVPYIRHDDLDVPSAKKLVSAWAPSAFANLLSEMNSHIGSMEELVDVAKIRKDCLTVWFEGSSRIVGIPRSDVLSGLRKVFFERLSALTKARCAVLGQVTTGLEDVIENWSHDSGESLAPDLWDDGMVEMDVTHGAKRFTKNLQNSLQGQTYAVDQCLQRYHNWTKSIEEVESVLSDQRHVRWQAIGDDFDDDLDEEEPRDQLLSKEDPEKLERILSESIESAVQSFNASLARLSRNFKEGNSADQKAAFLVRFTRRAVSSLPSSFTQKFDTDFVSQSYEPLSASIASSVGNKSRKAIMASLKQEVLATRPLWDDASDLPVIPSPWALVFVKDCHNAMKKVGTDLWTVSNVLKVKEELLKELAQILTTQQMAREGAVSDGKGDEKSSIGGAQPKQDACIQQLFDIFYLKEALKSPRSDKIEADNLQKHVQWLDEHAKLQPEKKGEICSGAAEYWKRTSLLFSLLG